MADKRKKFTPSMSYWLGKIHLLEKMKNRYLTSGGFSGYKKACALQEKIVIGIQNSPQKEEWLNDRSAKNKDLAEEIRRRVDINLILLEDIKNISMEFVGPIASGYYDREGNMTKKIKIFSADI